MKNPSRGAAGLATLGTAIATAFIVDEAAKTGHEMAKRKEDLKEIDYIADQYGVDRDGFGDYVHEYKDGVGRVDAIGYRDQSCETLPKNIKNSAVDSRIRRSE